MKIIKFTINEDYYDESIAICKKEEITIKKKLNVLLSQDIDEVSNIRDYFPLNYNENQRTVTLKVNEELYKGIIIRSDNLAIKSSKYVPYLIYRFLIKSNSKDL